jgi:hypothetical protein
MPRRLALSLFAALALASCAPIAEPGPSSVSVPADPALAAAVPLAAPAQAAAIVTPEPGACGARGRAEQPVPSMPPTGSRSFGAPMTAGLALTSLTDIAASPDRWKDQVVKTQGEIARVCQAAGCWMELRADAQAQPVRVPMAGHAFFLPRNAAGRHATIEGRVAIQELSAEAQAHLAGEGAQAIASSLSIAATSVVID